MSSYSESSYSGAGGVFKRYAAHQPVSSDIADGPPGVNMLLTTSGLATPALKSAAATLLKEAGYSSRKDHRLRVLAITDGQRIRDSKHFDGSKKRKHRGDAAAARFWTRATLKAAFGRKIKIAEINLRTSTNEQVAEALGKADVLYGAGGTIGLFAQGIGQHADLLREWILAGKPYIGESSGAMAVGENLLNLEPSDPNPRGVEQDSLGVLKDLRGLGILGGNVDVVAHAPGRDGALVDKLPPLRHPVLAGGIRLLSGYTTPEVVMDRVAAANPERTRLVIPTTGAALFTKGNLTLIGKAKVRKGSRPA